MDAKQPIIDAKPSSRTFGSRAGGEGGKRAAGRSLATPYSRAEGTGTIDYQANLPWYNDIEGVFGQICTCSIIFNFVTIFNK